MTFRVRFDCNVAYCTWPEYTPFRATLNLNVSYLAPTLLPSI